MTKRTLIIISTIVVILVGSFMVASAISTHFRNKDEKTIIKEKMLDRTLRFSDIDISEEKFLRDYINSSRSAYLMVIDLFDKQDRLPEGYNTLVNSPKFIKQVLDPMLRKLGEEYIEDNLTFAQLYARAEMEGISLDENIRAELDK